MVCTTRAYEPAAEVVHPGGGGAEGAIEAVTACLASSCVNGFAEAAAARARRTREYCIVLILSVVLSIAKIFYLNDDLKLERVKALRPRGTKER